MSETATATRRRVRPDLVWEALARRARAIAPEAYEGDEALNLIGGEWVTAAILSRSSRRSTER